MGVCGHRVAGGVILLIWAALRLLSFRFTRLISVQVKFLLSLSVLSSVPFMCLKATLWFSPFVWLRQNSAGDQRARRCCWKTTDAVVKGVTCDGFPFNGNTATSNIHVLYLNVLLMLVIARFAMHLSCLNHLLDCTVNLAAFSVGVLECCRNWRASPCTPMWFTVRLPGGWGKPLGCHHSGLGEQAVAGEALF